MGLYAEGGFDVGSGPGLLSVPLDWRRIDTTLARDWTDEALLEVAQCCCLTNGWGVVAEICKRFSERCGVDV